jgi:hypothetical protein
VFPATVVQEIRRRLMEGECSHLLELFGNFPNNYNENGVDDPQDESFGGNY